MSVKSSGSHDGPTQSTGDIIRSGTLKKMKTARKKFFVLRAETPDALARLEYYDSEKKFRSGVPPKRCIPLKTCFDINKRQDTKHKNVIALYTKDDCFCIVLESEEDLKAWLKDLLTLQHGEEMPEGETPKPKFEYVWQVQLCERGLGAGRIGLYRLCLTDKTVTLVKIDEPMPTVIELSLASVRSCGNLKNFFFLEVGRSSNLGAGEFWFEADDTNIASNLQATVSHRFKLIREKAKLAANTEETNDIEPKGRTRSSSATESSKSNNKRFNSLTSRGGSILPQVSGVAMSIYHHLLQRGSGKRRHSISGFRERCDSMPSRPRTSSEGNHAVPGWGKPYSVPYRAVHHRDASHSPPTGSPISPPSDSTGSSYSLPDEHDGPHDLEHQRMYSTLTPDEVIAEEECPESPRANPQTGNYLPMNHYTDMSGSHYGGHNFPSNSASMSSVTSGTPSTDMRFADYPLDKVFSYVSADDDDARPCRAYSVGSKPPEAQLASTPENSRVRAFSVGSKSKKYNRVLPPHHHPPGVKSSSAPLLAPNSRIGSSHGSINNPMDDLMEMDFSTDTTRSRTSTNASGSSEARAACNHRNSSCSNGSKSGLFGFLEHFGIDYNKKTPEGYVEMKPGSVRTTSASSDVSPYVDMTQGQRASAYMDMSGNNIPSVGHAYSPYLDMSGNNGAHSGNNTPQVGNDDSPYMDMSGGNNNVGRENYMDMAPGSSPVRSSPRPSMTLSEYVRQMGRSATQENNRNNDYMDMYQSRRRANSNSSMPRVATSPGAWSNDHNSDYLDMTGKNNNRRTERTNSFGSQMSSSPHLDTTSPKYSSDYVPFGVQDRIPEASAHDIDGYVQMTPGDFASIGNSKHPRQSSIDSMDNEHGDYLNMSGINLGTNPKSKPSKKERSQPISIQTTSNNQGVKNSSPISISSLLGRKSSPTGTSPKMHLPLSPYSSLPRQKSPRKYSHTGSSKDSSSVSSSVTTTPSSSSTMFPLSLNSPSSPAAGSSKTGTPTTMKVPVSILNVPYKSGNSSRKKVNNEDDYAMMDFEPSRETRREVDESPYINYCPPGASALKTPVTLVSKCDDHSDYAIMKPGTLPTKPTTLPRAKSGGSSSGLTSPLANHLSSVGLNDRQTMCFRPIREKDERMPSPKPGDQVPEKLTQDDKTLETANMEVEDDAPYDTLRSPSGPVSPAAKISRPNSSNSEKIKSGTQRPASTTGMEKNSRPSSVCSEGLNSRLGSTSSVYSSSSSTSTVVGASTKSDQPECDQPSQSQHVINLHYASLDLSNDPEARKSPRPSSSNDVNLAPGETTTFVYADIDFIRSEELSRGQNNGSVGSSTGTAIRN